MNVLKQDSQLLNISSLVEVFQYSVAENSQVVFRIQLGDDSNGIAGNGLYQVRYDIDGLKRDDYIDIGSGVTKSFFHSPRFSVFNTEVLKIFVLGQAGDTNVRVRTVLSNIDSQGGALLFGRGGEDVWSKKEKDLVVDGVKKIINLIDKLPTKESVKSLSDEPKKELRFLIENISALTKLVNSIESLLESKKDEDNFNRIYLQIAQSKDLINNLIFESSRLVDLNNEIGKVLLEVNLIRDIVLKTTDTKVLEGILNENVG